MRKTLLYSIIALALLLGLILPMAVPVIASEIAGAKMRDPDLEPYDVGDTIFYVMNVTNPISNPFTNNLTSIRDILPDGTEIEFLYEGSPHGNADGGKKLVQLPGQTDTFTASYTVRAADLEWIVPPVGEPYWGVRNRFQAEGIDSHGDQIDLERENIAEVIPPAPPVGGEAFPVSKLSILVPWIALGAMIIAGVAIFVRRRHVRS